MDFCFGYLKSLPLPELDLLMENLTSFCVDFRFCYLKLRPSPDLLMENFLETLAVYRKITFSFVQALK